MVKKIEINEVESVAPPKVNEFQRFLRVMVGRKVVLVGMTIIIISIITAIFAPQIAPYDPNKVDMDNALLSPSWQHLLGTDAMGRDTLSRIIYGARTSMIIGLSAVIIASTIGITLGLVAGYAGGLVYSIIMRLIDAFMAFPIIMLVLVIASLLGQGLKNIVISLGVGMMASYARMVCGQVMSVKENEYILAERSIGSKPIRIMLVHVLPNCMAPVIVMMTMMLGSVILMEAGLSFLGVGISPPTAAWGAMVNNGYRYLISNPILSIAPGVAIMLVVFAFNMVGDGLRDTLDPRLRGTL
jgi:peptide/nickel transport system permease protein